MMYIYLFMVLLFTLKQSSDDIAMCEHIVETSWAKRVGKVVRRHLQYPQTNTKSQ